MPTISPDRPVKLLASVAFGAGYFHARSGATDDRRTFSGGTVAWQLTLAGRLGQNRTVAIGGTFLRDHVFSLSSKDELTDGDEPDLDEVGFGLWMLGLFSDFAFQQAPGLHVQAIGGLSGLSVDAPGRDTDSPFGLALNLGVGYDFRVGRHFALGALLRATYAPLYVDESAGTSVATLAPSLLFIATTR